MAVDASGNVYVANSYFHTIRKITPGGQVSTLAGSSVNVGGVDAVGEYASFRSPQGIAVSADGTVYVADTDNHTIRKITPGGSVTTLAGSAGNLGSADGTGSAARFNQPARLTLDSSGNVYVSDTSNHTIRKITPGGVVSTLAGSAGNFGSADGTGMAARFNEPTGIVVDVHGFVYVADASNHTIRKIAPGGGVTTLAGSAGSTGSADGSGTLARFNLPSGLVLDGNGNLLVADTGNCTIRKVTPSGVVTTELGVAGNMGSADGTGSAVQFYAPQGMAIDGESNIYVADSLNHTIRKISSTGVVSTYAGKAAKTGSSDGLGTDASFFFPRFVATDTNGNVYVSDNLNHTIRKITPDGLVTTLAGQPGVYGSTNGTGSSATFHTPAGLVVDSDGSVFVADTDNHIIRKITPAGAVTTFAGSPGLTGSANGTGTSARFSYPIGIAIDASHNLYVADTGNSTIRKITSDGIVTTLAGAAGTTGSTDGTGSAARFKHARNLTVGLDGCLYVADSENYTVRKVTAAGVVTTFAGSAGQRGYVNGYGTNARFTYIYGIATAHNGNIYVSDFYNYTVREITTTGNVYALVDDSAQRSPFLFCPLGIAVDPYGNLYVAEDMNQRIDIFVPPRAPVVTTGAASNITSKSATVTGTFHAKGLTAGTFMVYGSPNGVESNARHLTISPGTGLTTQTITANLTGLQPGTTYHYRVSAHNTLGTSNSDNQYFTTPYPIIVTTLAGSPGVSGSTDGIGSAARFNVPFGVGVDGSGNVIVADNSNRTIRKVTPAGTTSLVAGQTGMAGTADGTSSTAMFMCLYSPVVDSNGNIYVISNDCIRKITPGGDVTTFAGSPTASGNVDGTGTAARFNHPLGLAIDKSNTIYVADTSNHTIRAIAPNGMVYTLAGSPGVSGNIDADGSAARFSSPSDLTVDSNNSLYVADTGNKTIRKVLTSTGTTFTVAGIPGSTSSLDGVGTAARFTSPRAITMDNRGNLFVVDANSIRWITPNREVSTLAGNPGVSGSTDGNGSVARFNGACDIAADGNGTLYVADSSSHTIRRISLATSISLTSSMNEGGTISSGGTFGQGTSQTITATPNEAYQFTNWTENGAVVSTEANYTFTVSGDRILVANFAMKPFYQWWAAHRPAGEVNNPAVSGPAATPHKDGTPNVLKYLCGIDPSVPLGEADKGALPVMDVNDVGPRRYLTLTHRKNPAANELTVQVQVSTDLLNWVTVTPDSTQTVGHDGVTGDPLVEYQVDTQGATQKFIRLNVVAP